MNDSKRARYLGALEHTDIQTGGAIDLEDIPRAKAFRNTLINIDLKPKLKKVEKLTNLVKFLFYLREKIFNKILELLQVHVGLKV